MADKETNHSRIR